MLTSNLHGNPFGAHRQLRYLYLGLQEFELQQRRWEAESFALNDKISKLEDDIKRGQQVWFQHQVHTICSTDRFNIRVFILSADGILGDIAT